MESVETFAIYIAFAFLSFALSFICLGLVRKIRARMQNRKGPPITQPIWDFFKLIGKEEIYNGLAQNFLLILSVFFSLTAAIITLSLIFGVIQSINFLFLAYFMAFPQILICLAGISSKNVYSMIGGERGIIQSVLSEIIFIFGSSLFIFCLFKTLNIYPEMHHKFTLFLLLPIVLLYIPVLMSIIAQINLNPFSISDAHQEIVSGYATEFSGIAYAYYLLSKSLKFLSLLLITSFLFMGVFFMKKVLPVAIFSILALFVASWISVSLPRMRINRYVKITLLLLLLEILGGLMLYAKVV